jgi:L-ascorbate metabolism protein UlaG (beta-lactamase superfamily)
MEIQYFGQNCIRITTKKANIIIDDLFDDDKKSLIKEGDTVLFTEFKERKLPVKAKLVIDIPGEYEIADTAIVGIPAFGHNSDDKLYNNTIYKIENEDIKLAVIGNVAKELTNTQLELLGDVDVVIIPVGNHEVTLSGSEALSIIKNIEPYVVIPTHYSDGKTIYKTPQADLSDVLKELGMEPTETLPKIKLKSSNFNEGESTKLIVLEV